MANNDFDYALLGAQETAYKKRRRGLGIRNAIKHHTAATSKSDTFGQLFFRAIIAAAPLTKFRVSDAIIKAFAMMGGSHNTKGYSFPLFLDKDDFQNSSEDIVSNRSHKAVLELDKTVAKDMHKTTLPIDMLKAAVGRTSYLAIMEECLCRKIQGCSDYPLDLGCLFLGPAARVCVERGIAHRATAEEAAAHIDRAQAAGLSAAAYFVEVEEYVWGFRDEEMPDFLEICFCCPCCCSAVLFEQRSGGELKRILHQGIGWSCVVDTQACIGCGACVEACPHGRMEVAGGKALPTRQCAGCGQCLRACPQGALHVRKTSYTKPQLEDYFEKLHAHL